MFGEKASSTNDGMITRTRGLGWSTILFIKQHSYKYDLHNNQQTFTKHYFIWLSTQIYCWPSFLHY
jgi:hypothetical protein